MSKQKIWYAFNTLPIKTKNFFTVDQWDNNKAIDRAKEIAQTFAEENDIPVRLQINFYTSKTEPPSHTCNVRYYEVAPTFTVTLKGAEND